MYLFRVSFAFKKLTFSLFTIVRLFTFWLEEVAAASVISGEASRTHVEEEQEEEQEEEEVADLPSAGDHESSAEVDDGKLDFRSLQQQHSVVP